MFTRTVVDTVQENKGTTENNTQSSHKSSSDVANPVGLVNYANDCFFNFAILVLFSLKIFCDHVRHFDGHNSYTINIDEQNSHTTNAALSIKKLFRAIEEIRLKSNETRTSLMHMTI